MPKLIDCIEAVAFDLDGTLIDTAPDLGAAANMMLVMLGGRPLPEQIMPSLIGAGIDQFVNRVLTRSGVVADRGQLIGAGELFRELYGQRMFARSRVYPGVAWTLRALVEGGRTVCCITNKESRFALPLLETAGLDRRIAFTLCADHPEDRKPSPNLALAACARIGIEPAQLLCVGDSRADILAAHAAGCRVVAVDYGYHHNLPLAELHPEAVVSDVSEILELTMRPRNGARALRAIA